jgi:hypothetical protein
MNYHFERRLKPMDTKFYLKESDIQVVQYEDGMTSLHDTSGLRGTSEDYDRIMLNENDQKSLMDYLNKKFLASEKVNRLIKAADSLHGLLVEGLTDTQNDSWNEEIGEFLEALEQAKEE